MNFSGSAMKTGKLIPSLEADIINPLTFSFEDAAYELQCEGLITANQDFEALNIHRFVQDRFRAFLGNERCQKYYAAAVSLVKGVFPEQIKGRPLHLQWPACKEFIQHGTWLASSYNDSLDSNQPLTAPEELSSLLKDCAWYIAHITFQLIANFVRYLHEIREIKECLRISTIALRACPANMVYAHLHNSIGALQWIQNNLREARVHFELALPIMKDNLGFEDEEYIGVLANVGSALASECRDEDSLVAYREVERVRTLKRLPKNIGLAFLHLGVGRIELRMGNMPAARERFRNAEEVIRKQHGPQGLYMAE